MRCRLLVVARRFWPIWEEPCQRLIEWTTMLRQNGIAVTVLTARWHNSWPAESTFRENRIVRLLPGPKSAWNETLFIRNVGIWVTKHRHEFDKIYVDESASLLHQLNHKHVVGDRQPIARYQGLFAEDPASPIPFQAVSNACDGCRKAGVVVAPNPVAHRQLQSSGVLPNQIVRIPDVAWQPKSRDIKQRQAAARSLRAVNQDFALPADCKLLTYFGDPTLRASTFSMLDALIRLAEREPKLRVWMFGGGSGLSEMYDRVKSAGVHHEILFQSPFDDWESILHLSDGIIFPNAESGSQFFIPHALAAGLPIIVGNATAYRSQIPEVLQPRFVDQATPEGFYGAVESWFREHDAWLNDAEKARQSVVAENSRADYQQAWLKLLLES